MSAAPLDAPAEAALQRYRVLAITVGVGLLVLVLVGVPLNHDLLGVGHRVPEVSAVVGPLHGLIFAVYVGVTLDLARRRRWSLLRTALVAAAGTVPFASFFVERHVVARERAAAAPVA